MTNTLDRHRSTWSTWVRWLIAALCAIGGLMLLIAEKTAAGAALVGVAIVLAAPLGRIIRNQRAARWTRVVAVILLLAIVVIGVAGTDLRPDQVRTGFPPVDKIVAIFEGFLANLPGAE